MLRTDRVPHARPVFLVFSLLLAPAALAASACGGNTDYWEQGHDGDGGESGSSSGASGSSSGVSGSSSGISGSSSGVSGSSSGISGSSSGGNPVCTPLPGCDSNSECPVGDGCNWCTCDPATGTWTCTSLLCPIDGGTCPSEPPPFDSACDSSGITCDYDTFDGSCGGESCSCDSGMWLCTVSSCPPPPPQCQATEPGNGEACGGTIGLTCDYYNSSTDCTDECQCGQSGTWGCIEASCGGIDAGFGSGSSSSGGGPGI